MCIAPCAEQDTAHTLQCIMHWALRAVQDTLYTVHYALGSVLEAADVYCVVCTVHHALDSALEDADVLCNS